MRLNKDLLLPESSLAFILSSLGLGSECDTIQ